MSFDLIMFVNAKELMGMSAAETHRLPLIYSLARHLRNRGRVLVVKHYVSLCADFPRYPRKAVRRMLSRYERGTGDNLFFYTPVILFNLAVGRHFATLRRLNRSQLQAQFRRVLNKYGFSSATPRVVWLSHPLHIDYLGLVGERVAAYDCLEEFSLVGQAERNIGIVEVEKALARRVNIILAAGLSHTERLMKENPRTYDFPAAVDAEKFGKVSDPKIHVAEEIRRIAQPRIGFSGCLKSHDDFDLLEKIIFLRASWSFVFVGEVAASPPHLSQHRTIHQVDMTVTSPRNMRIF